MNLVLPRSIGWCEIVPVSKDERRQLLKVGCGETV
jgi:hypothetical protein